MAPANFRTVQVVETRTGWVDTGTKECTESAAAMLAKIRAEDARDLAKHPELGGIVTTIEWQPTTATGRAILKVITETAEE